MGRDPGRVNIKKGKYKKRTIKNRKEKEGNLGNTGSW